MRVNLKGICKITSKGHVYYYAWRGGPRLTGEPGTPEFVASFNKAVEDLKTPDGNRFKALVAQYKASGDYKTLADSTRKQWSRWLDTISDYFGKLSIKQFDRAGRSGRSFAGGGASGPISRARPTTRCRYCRVSSASPSRTA